MTYVGHTYFQLRPDTPVMVHVIGLILPCRRVLGYRCVASSYKSPYFLALETATKMSDYAEQIPDQEKVETLTRVGVMG